MAVSAGIENAISAAANVRRFMSWSPYSLPNNAAALPRGKMRPMRADGIYARRHRPSLAPSHAPH
jgi:hypothetical protein